MLKVLVIGSTYDLPEVHIFAGLVKEGVEIHATASSDSKLVATLKEFGIQCTTLDFKSRLDFAAIRKLRALIRKEKFDILHCLTARAVSNALIASWGMPVKRIAYRGTSGRDSKFNPASWMTFLNPGLHKIICVSNAVRSFMGTMIPDSKLATIYKGHDVRWYIPKRKVLLSEFSIPVGAFVVACVANLRPVKGIQYLLRALRHISPEEEVRILLIGEVRNKADVEDLKDPVIGPRVHIAGYQSDVSSILVECNAFVLPSVSREGLPKAMLESMAVGVPTIVTNVGGMPEVVKDSVNGLVVAPRNEKEIADAILRLRHDPVLAKSLGAAGKRTIEETFNVPRSVRETLAIYREVTR